MMGRNVSSFTQIRRTSLICGGKRCCRTRRTRGRRGGNRRYVSVFSSPSRLFFFFFSVVNIWICVGWFSSDTNWGEKEQTHDQIHRLRTAMPFACVSRRSSSTQPSRLLLVWSLNLINESICSSPSVFSPPMRTRMQTEQYVRLWNEGLLDINRKISHKWQICGPPLDSEGFPTLSTSSSDLAFSCVGGGFASWQSITAYYSHVSAEWKELFPTEDPLKLRGCNLLVMKFMWECQRKDREVWLKVGAKNRRCWSTSVLRWRARFLQRLRRPLPFVVNAHSTDFLLITAAGGLSS